MSTAIQDNNAARLTGSAAALVNLARYPIADLDQPAGKQLLAECRQHMAESGACGLPEFVTPQATEIMREEANAVTHRAYFCHSTHNTYLEPDDPSFPADHPRRIRHQTDVGSVAYDHIPADATLRRLYHWDPLRDFIAAVLGYEQLHRFADPLGALSINVFTEGGAHGWHFDESEFTTTLMLQAAERGGHFEYAPHIRDADNENYDAVARVLAGDTSNVKRLSFEPGTLLIFAGRNTIHRLTRVAGKRPRLVPILCYTSEPGMTNSDEVRKLFWGRTGHEGCGSGFSRE
ncbi:MAG: HalD/BesD family halogenase [Gammaproteobacteria bacterium]